MVNKRAYINRMVVLLLTIVLLVSGVVGFFVSRSSLPAAPTQTITITKTVVQQPFTTTVTSPPVTKTVVITVTATPPREPLKAPARPSDVPYFKLMVETDHFKIYFNPEDEAIASRMVDVCESIYLLLVDLYGGAPPDATKIFIFHSYEDLLSLGNPSPNLRRDDSFGCFTCYGKLSEEVGDHVEFYNIKEEMSGIEGGLGHEVGHRFFYYVYPNIRKPVRPNWLDEGMAAYAGIKASGTVPSFIFQPIVDSVKTGQPQLAELHRLDELQASSNRVLFDLFYGEAAAIIIYIIYIIERYGKDALHQILREYDKTLDLDGAVMKVLNVSLKDLEREWMDLMKETAAQSKNGEDFFNSFVAKAKALSSLD
jgi:hypothetical protein